MFSPRSRRPSLKHPPDPSRRLPFRPGLSRSSLPAWSGRSCRQLVVVIIVSVAFCGILQHLIEKLNALVAQRGHHQGHRRACDLTSRLGRYLRRIRRLRLSNCPILCCHSYVSVSETGAGSTGLGLSGFCSVVCIISNNSVRLSTYSNERCCQI